MVDTRASNPPLPGLVVTYAPQHTLDDDNAELAVALLDSWTETVPSQQQSVTAAFGFNAPASRPPQAILLAVPPVDNAPLDSATLLDILAETRDLVHARMGHIARPTRARRSAAVDDDAVVLLRHCGRATGRLGARLAMKIDLH